MKYENICEICNISYMSPVPHKKTCSDKCYRDRYRKITGRYSEQDNMSTGTVGAIAELLVSSDLMKKGYAVFRALSPSCFCDVLAHKDNKILKIEIRTGYRYKNTGKINFPLKCSKNIDCFGIFERISGDVIYLDNNKNIINLNEFH